MNKYAHNKKMQSNIQNKQINNLKKNEMNKYAHNKKMQSNIQINK